MPSAILPSLIPPQNFEVLRNQIGAVIALEMAAQYARDNTYPNIAAVDVERFISYDANTELPRINVSVQSVTFSGKSNQKQDGIAIYNIDIYTTSNSTAGSEGDKASMILMSKIAGMVRAILNFPGLTPSGYTNLGLPNGSIGKTSVDSFTILDKAAVKDALSNVVGRLQFSAYYIEPNVLDSPQYYVNELTATIHMKDSAYGFFYDYKQRNIVVTATGATLTNAFFATPVDEIDLLDEDGREISVYALNVDYTQSGTTITATTFTFTSGTTITAKTGL